MIRNILIFFEVALIVVKKSLNILELIARTIRKVIKETLKDEMLA